MGCVHDHPKNRNSHSNNNQPAPNPAKPGSSDLLPITRLESKKMYKDRQETTLEGAFTQPLNQQTQPGRQTSTTNPGKKKITPKKKPARGQSVESFCEQIFNQYDKDNNGHLTLTEFRIMLRELIDEDLTEREVRDYRKAVDNNDNNRVELSEFKRLYQMLVSE